MAYQKPFIIAQNTLEMAKCNPSSHPSGRPCNKPGPGGH